MAEQATNVEQIGTADTYTDAELPSVTDAVDRAIAQGHDPKLYGEEPAEVRETRSHVHQMHRALQQAGKVRVRWEGDTLALKYQGREARYRGGAVEGRDHTYEVVRDLARELRQAVDGEPDA